MTESIVTKGCRYVGIVALGLGATVLALTNPGQREYENFAANTTLTVLRGDVCQGRQGNLSPGQQHRWRNHCEAFAKRGETEIREFFTHNTDRKDLVLCSFYRTELPPNYALTVIGIYNRFFLLSVDEVPVG